jgi:hypothetical protein
MEKIRIILGTLEDVTGFFVLPKFVDLLSINYFKLYGFPYGLSDSIVNYTEPLALFPLFFLTRFLEPITIFNFFVVITLGLTFWTSKKFFSIFTENNYINYLLAVIYTTSPYMNYHIQSHPQLTQVWVSITFLMLLLTYQKSFLKNLLMGLLLSIVFLMSNYIGFFTLLFIGSYFVVESLVDFFRSKNFNKTKENIYTCLSIVVPFILISLSWVRFSILQNPTNTGIENALNRTIDDFITFSAKPWLYFTPPIDNPFLGQVGQNIVYTLKNNWGQFWTQNFFKDEMQPLYIGIANLILIGYGIKNIYKNKINETSRKLIILGISSLILILITLPPFFTIGGITIYLPSFLIWKYLPMFRVLSRASFINYLVILTYAGSGAMYLINKYKNKGKYLVTGLLIFSFLEHITPYKITTISEVPEIYNFIKTIKEDESFVIYPQSESKSFFFWMTYHQKPLTNPTGYKSGEYDAKKLTQELTTCDGLRKAAELKVRYLIVYNLNNENTKFSNSTNLKLLKNFNRSDTPESNNYFMVNVNNASYVPETFVYEINPKLDCSNQ